MLKAIRRALAALAMAVVFSCAAIYAFALLHPSPAPDDVSKSDLIVVLGAGMDPDGTLHRSSVLRVETGVALWQAGAAPRVHFTGGMGVRDGPSAGGQMAALAHSLGVPADVTSHEGRSLSTLQNALFSQPFVSGADHIRLVTEGFHLPRSWLSFKWAAWHAENPQPSISLTHSERLRANSPGSRFPQITMVLRETVAFWFNGLRVAAFEIGGITGVPMEDRTPWLD